MRKAQGYVLPNTPLAKSNLVGLARGPYPAHSLSSFLLGWTQVGHTGWARPSCPCQLLAQCQ